VPHLKDNVEECYSDELDKPLGCFLLKLKKRGHPFYKKFLNKYGDLEYSQFRITDKNYLKSKGIYAYTLNSEIVYIGRCNSSLKQRINQGYGKIHPKNCYIDGQATNCHLNAKITKSKDRVDLWFHKMTNKKKINELEKQLIKKYHPKWNIKK